MLVCFWLGTTLHEQETAQSGQFAQTSNLLFPGPGKSKMVQTSNLLFPGPGKNKMVQTSNLLFPNPGKSKMVQTSNLLFPGPGKSKTARLPICFFPVQTSNLLFSKPGKSKMVQTSFLLFPGPGKSKMVQTSNLFFPGPGKSKMVQTSNLLFPGPGKSKKMYQTCSLESGLETSSACGAQAHDLLLLSLAPYPLGHSSLKNMLFPGFTKKNWMSNLLFRLKLPICFFPGVPTVLYAHLQP